MPDETMPESERRGPLTVEEREEHEVKRAAEIAQKERIRRLVKEKPIGGGQGPEEERIDDEWIRRQEQYARGRRHSEIIRSAEKPKSILYAARQIVSSEESKETVEPPNRWLRDNTREIINDRLGEARLRLNRELIGDWGLREIIYGATIDRKTGEKIIGEETLNEEELKELVSGLEIAGKEFWARYRLLEAYRQHRSAGMDLEEITVKLFTSLYKVYPEAGWLKTIGQAKETLPNTERLGTMVDKALHTWCDIGEREENVFNKERYESTYQEALDEVTSKIVGQEISEEERKHSLLWQDAQNAARLAEEIFRLFDLDVAYDKSEKPIDLKDQDAVRKWNEGLKNFLLHTPGAGAGEWSFKGGMNSGDIAKICHFILRQVNEFGRDHPRQIGAPAVVGCFPNLTVDFMRMITVKAKTKEGVRPKIEKAFNLWTLWREKKIPFGDLPWGEKEWENGVEILRQKGLISKDEAEREWEISGIEQDIYDFPYTVQHFNAVGTVFSAITRKDLGKAFEEAQNPNYFRGINKGWESTFALMTDGVGLGKLEEDKRTMTKLRQLAKVNFLIGILVANVHDPSAKRGPREAVVTSDLVHPPLLRRQFERRFETTPKTLIANVYNSAIKARFLSATPGNEEQIKKEMILLGKAIGGEDYGLPADFDRALGKGKTPRRRGFLPSESGWFDEKELEAIRKSGLFAPYNQV